MKINVNNLKNEISALNKLLDEYEENYLNYYNVLSSFSFDWNDGRAPLFFDSLKKEKMYCANLGVEIKELKEVYDYAVDRYQSIGSNISINLSAKKKILRNYDNYINKTSAIITKFNNLDLSFCSPGIATSIRNRKSKLVEMKNKAANSKKYIEKLFNDIDSIEDEIRRRLNRIDVTQIVETDISGMY